MGNWEITDECQDDWVEPITLLYGIVSINGEFVNWRIGELENWRIGELENWGIADVSKLNYRFN
ncbi:MAG: hypothetical protein GC181_02950 [Bacteroidetes bacterium]|nr:hypothetical protein [Bacteroidota bacterium]